MGPGEEDKKQEQKESYVIKTEQVHEDAVHQEGGSQTQANLQTNEPKLVETQIEENMQLVSQAQAAMEKTHATETAQGGPVCEQITQNEKFFQRRKRRKLQTRLAKQLSGNENADYVSYNLHQAQVLKKTMTDNSKRLLGIPANADSYLSKFFLKGCQLDQNGQPASPQDMQNLIDDQRVWEVFSGSNVMARKPYLDNMVDDVLKVDLTMDKLTPEYLERHGMEVLRQSQLLTEAEKVLFSDPVNKQYSCALPDTVLIQIRKVLKANRMLKMDKLVQQAFEKHGVKGDGSGTWSDEWTKKKESAYKAAIKQMKETRTDPDLPIPVEALTREELKLRRQKQTERIRKSANSPFADHLTYVLDRSGWIEDSKTGKELKTEDKRCNQALFRTYEIDQDGNPSTPMARSILEYNLNMERVMDTGRIEEFKPYLDNYLNELLNFIPGPEEVTDEYLEDHIEVIHHRGQLIGGFDNLRGRPFIREYIDSLPESVQMRIKNLDKIHMMYTVATQDIQGMHLVDTKAQALTDITEDDMDLRRDVWAQNTSKSDFLDLLKKNAALLKEYRDHPINMEEEIRKERRDRKEAN